MIDLITGLPGNAKTLYTIGMVKAWAARESRPVYYAGIPNLTLDWAEIDPVKWMDCPPKSIVVIDECQKIFRNRSLGAQPPKHVTDLETHRHLGIDLVFITQHPSLVDPAIRKLTQRHRHLVRVWGMEMSTVHQWDAVRDNCDKPVARRDSEKTKWKFDRSLFNVYKSADEHTFKRSIPMRVKLLMLAPLALALCGYMVYAIMGPKLKATEAGKGPNAVPGIVAPAMQASAGKTVPFDRVADARHFVDVSTPRVEGLAYTAPKYDELTKPVRVPVPAACIQRGTVGKADVSCSCYSQQGTPLDVKLNMCIEFARNGFFQEFDAERDRQQSERTANSVKVLEGRDAPASQPGGPSVVSFATPADDPPKYPRVGSGGKAG